MHPIGTKLWATMNRLMSALYRRTNGKLGSWANGPLPVMLLTVPGRKSGVERTAPVCYIERDGGYLVIGSAGGYSEDPQWFKNLAATDRARIRIKSSESEVGVHIAVGEERDALWRDVVIVESPGFLDYERKSGRTIPIAVLTPQK
ncbi:nitroreductase family deazaflavin-dependent oxidoreductase [Aldersonia sp. NBC_00410]|uniref:nitroreductase/quinone reductase family protein n=1 Tax=Aldersonia sp. NBC_00410 TaxID=2975954 RepID=UPI00224E34FB|nr:nitroreductase/quinone reductase family protein [Aldersonia sp. NBC_00410]MCX5042536.1 nitroreductase family deazaflavin-dependent oxidoreductase [Aldersonia sp. NBC_00410]